MIDGTSALQLQKPTEIQSADILSWSHDQYIAISVALQKYGCEYLKGRNEYILFKEVVSPKVTELLNFRQNEPSKTQ